VNDREKFSEFSKKFYLDTVGIGPFSEPINQPKQWVSELAKASILVLLEISHFGRAQDVTNCVKQLMEVTHGGYLWVEVPISIDVEIITYITGPPSRGETPVQYLDEKMKEKALAEEMKKMYDT
jgi:hypothetical protein